MSSVQRSSRVRAGVGDTDGAEALVEAGVPCAVHAVTVNTIETIRPSVRRRIPGDTFRRYYEVVADTTSP